jgi:hypothetical protein
MLLLAIVLIILAVVLGVGGVFFAVAKWILIIAVVLLLAGLVVGFLGRGRSRSQL